MGKKAIIIAGCALVGTAALCLGGLYLLGYALNDADGYDY